MVRPYRRLAPPVPPDQSPPPGEPLESIQDLILGANRAGGLRSLTVARTHNIMVKPAEALIPITENGGLDTVRLVALVAVICTIGFAVARFIQPKKFKSQLMCGLTFEV